MDHISPYVEKDLNLTFNYFSVIMFRIFQDVTTYFVLFRIPIKKCQNNIVTQ